MFTGLVESTGTVISFQQNGDQARIILDLPFSAELTLGESVAVNGCCLTVAEFLPHGVAFDLLSQTLQVTALGDLNSGKHVNLERAMLASTRFGGHIVQGHIDGTGFISAIDTMGQDHRLCISLPPEIHRLAIAKGSMTIDGISLTIAEVTSDSVIFYIIPHTWTLTHLSRAALGQRVNLEADSVTKTIDALLTARGII